MDMYKAEKFLQTIKMEYLFFSSVHGMQQLEITIDGEQGPHITAALSFFIVSHG